MKHTRLEAFVSFVPIPILAAAMLAACTDDSAPAEAPDASTAPDVGTTPRDSGGTDTPTDAGSDAPIKDANAPLACTGGAALAITGRFVDTTGTQHWLGRTATATTYTRIPSGDAGPANAPVLWNITQVCSDAKFFVAVNESSKYARVDWAEDPSGIRLCVVVDGAADAKAVLATPLSGASATSGCKGGAWTTLSKKDGGL